VTGRAAQVVELSQRRLPHQSRDEAAFMHEHPEAFDWLHRLVALDPASAVVGFAAVGRPHFMEPHRSFLRVVVAREHEGRGIGRMLRAEALSLVPPDTAGFFSGVYDDEPRALAVARRWGFGVDEHSITSELALTDVEPVVPPPGVTVESVPDLDFPDPDAVEAMLLASQTNPEAQQGWRFDLARLAACLIEGCPVVCVVTRVDGEPAAITFGDVSQGVLGIAYSGVDPAHRGRGLMVLTKRHAHAVAVASGATVSRTSNEEHNAGIRRINAELGYRVTSGTYRLSRRTGELTPTAPDPS
jgi:GNAT superfamily N-acetyltransferase